MAVSREDAEAEAARLLDPTYRQNLDNNSETNQSRHSGGVIGSSAGGASAGARTEGTTAGGAGGGAGRTAGGGGRGGVRAKGSAGNGGEDSYFECNICLDGVREPVVTRCGHLFCWPCLYRWLNTNQTECPVCKAGVTATNVIPLYGRGADSVDPRTKNTGRDGVPSRPEAERPRAERPRVPNPFAAGFGMGPGWAGFPGIEGGATGAGGMAGGQMQFQAGLGFFPSLFGLQFQSFTAPARPPNTAGAAGQGAGAAEGGGAGGSGVEGERGAATGVGASGGIGGQSMVTGEYEQQAFLSRLLLMLGFFVVLCLVLF